MKPVIIHDTRDKPGKHENVDRYLAEQGYQIVRSKLYVGDVSLLHDQRTCIDLKQGLGEVEGNLTSQHERFRRECQKAQEAGIRLIVLAEEPGIQELDGVRGWRNSRRSRWDKIDREHSCGRMLHIHISPRPPIDGKTMADIMAAMTERYGVEWQFCEKSQTGERICEILGLAHGPSTPGSSGNGCRPGRFVSR